MSLYLGTEPLKEQGEEGGNVQTQTAFSPRKEPKEVALYVVALAPNWYGRFVTENNLSSGLNSES